MTLSLLTLTRTGGDLLVARFSKTMDSEVSNKAPSKSLSRDRRQDAVSEKRAAFEALHRPSGEELMKYVLIVATVAWFVIAWNIFDPLSTIMFEPVKIPDAIYYKQVGELNSKFYPLMLGPPACVWTLWLIAKRLWRRRILNLKSTD
jgi:hypothetical protein